METKKIQLADHKENSMTKRMAVRQGDVLLLPVTDAKDIEPAPADARGVVLAEGEMSGHHHQVFGGGAKLFRFRDGRGDRLLTVGKAGADVRVVGGGSGGVDRHEPIKIAGGKWIVRIQRTWTSAMARRVED